MSTEQSETYTPCITLSDSLCDYTFKNVLRANESNVYNEHRLLTENNCKHINRKKEHTRIFNDDYKKRGLNEGKCKTIYQSSYLKGNLKTNITFDESIRDTMPTKTSQVKRYDVMKNYQSNTDNLKLNHSNKAESFTRAKFVNDTYKKNPIVNSEEQVANSRFKNLAKTNRVKSYMSSDLIKQTAFSNKDEKNTNHYDKITNKNFTNSQTATQDQERKYKKSYKHVIGEGGQMFYL